MIFSLLEEKQRWVYYIVNVINYNYDDFYFFIMIMITVILNVNTLESYLDYNMNPQYRSIGLLVY